MKLVASILFIALAGCASSVKMADVRRKPSSDSPKPPCPTCIAPSSTERFAELSRARIMVPSGGDRLDRSIFEGPGRSAYIPKWNETIRCKFVEPVAGKPMGGASPKFNCEASIFGKAVSLRIKYQNPELLQTGRSSEENEGIWGDILTSRLMWRLGFYAKEIYPVRVICENCPVRPWEYIEAVTEPADDLTPAELDLQLHPARLRELVLPIAEISVRSEAPIVETYRDQGWSWAEFASARPATPDLRAEHDALALLAAFMQHADNKAEQQELRCVGGVGPARNSCAEPAMMIGDVGMTFGVGYKQIPMKLPNSEIRRLRNLANDQATVSLEGFSQAPLWSNVSRCVTSVRFKESTGSPADQEISEAGRKLFLERMDRLTDQNILDLFTAARVEQRGESILVGGQPRPVTAADWLPAFRARLAKVRSVVCPL